MLGIQGNKAFKRDADWREYMRNWAAPQSMESRISGLLEKNLFLPTDTFIASIAQKYGMPYTEGKKVEDRFYSDDGRPIYPLNDGFVGEPEKITLKVGEMLVDRYGPVYGGYVSPKNVSFEARALPRTTKIEEYSVFVIKKDIKDVLSGGAAAWFGEPGGGTQYKLPLGTKQLLKEGYLEVMEQ